MRCDIGPGGSNNGDGGGYGDVRDGGGGGDGYGDGDVMNAGCN